MSDNALFWLWFILIVIAIVIFVLFFYGDNCESGKRKKGRGDERIGEAAEGSAIILSIPLLVYILFFILIGLVALGYSTMGKMDHLHGHVKSAAMVGY